jgi:uncharacterized protein
MVDMPNILGGCFFADVSDVVVTNFTPIQAALGGALIGVSAVVMLLFLGRIAGVAGIIRRALIPTERSQPLEAMAFLGGLAAAPALWAQIFGQPLSQSVSSNLILMSVAGLLVGFGAAWGNGCTSGHGVCGVSRFSIRSLVATATFMAAAIATVFVVRHVSGGWVG